MGGVYLPQMFQEPLLVGFHRHQVVPAAVLVWARALFHGLFVTVFHGLKPGTGTLNDGRGGEGCGPRVAGARRAAEPMTVGQAAGRSGRDPQHVALSSLAAFTLSTKLGSGLPAFMLSVLVDRAQPGQLLKGMLYVQGKDLP
mgnify:CR=1 FL=1